jgi:hypothetical protein
VADNPPSAGVKKLVGTDVVKFGQSDNQQRHLLAYDLLEPVRNLQFSLPIHLSAASAEK